MLPDEPHCLPLGEVAPDLADQHHHLLKGDCPAVVIIKHGESLNKFLLDKRKKRSYTWFDDIKSQSLPVQWVLLTRT